MIEVTQLKKSFGSFCAVDDISFVVEPQKITGLLGANGAGKTTTLRLLVGLATADSGTIRIHENEFLPHNRAIKAKIGYLPESVPLYPNLTPFEHLVFFGEMRGLSRNLLSERIQVVIELCKLKPVLEKKSMHLSKGFRQRLGLALALLHDPEILILDEPTEGLDPLQIHEIRKLLQNLAQTKTILVSSHILSEIENLCQNILVLKNGKLLASGPLDNWCDHASDFEKKLLEILQ